MIVHGILLAIWQEILTYQQKIIKEEEAVIQKRLLLYDSYTVNCGLLG